MWDKTNNIYEIDECDYCGNLGVIVRPSPFLADIGSKMCKHCWNETQKEYANSVGEYIPDFIDNNLGYEEIKKEYDSVDNNINIGVVTTPKWIMFNCPYCNDDIELDYDDFESTMVSDYWGDWEGSEVECPTCGHKLKINCVDYD